MMIPRLLLLATASFAALSVACGGSASTDDTATASALETEDDIRTRSLLTLDGPFFRSTTTCDAACAQKPPSERMWRSPPGAAALVGQGQFQIEFLEPMPPLGGAGQVPTRRARLTTDLPGILPSDPPTRFSQELVLEGIRPTGSIANTPTNIAEKAFVSEVSLEGSGGARTVQLVLDIDVRGRVNNVFLRTSHRREDDSGILLTSIFTNLTPGARPVAPRPAEEECWVDHVGDRCPSAERERIP